MHARVAIAVGDENLAIGRDGRARRMIERLAPARRVARAERSQQLALAREGEDLMRVAVGDETRSRASIAMPCESKISPAP